MKRLPLLVTLALVAACSGGGGHRVTPSAVNHAVTRAAFAGKTTPITVRIPAGLGRSVLSARRSNQARKLQYISPSVKSAVALQLCSQSETNGASQDGVTACKSGSVFDIVYDVTNPAVCPNYSATQPFSCTLQFPAGLSSGSQWELDLYDRSPLGGTNGVGGVLPTGGISGSFGGGDGAYTAYQCIVGTSACLLGAGLSDPRDPVTGSGPANPIAISQIEGFIQRPIGAVDINVSVALVASYNGSGGPSAPGSGAIGSFVLDAGGNTITGGTCIQDAGNEYANAFTPADDQGPGTSPGNGYNQAAAQGGSNPGGAGYHRDNGGQLSAADGSSVKPAAIIIAAEIYAGPQSNQLLKASFIPCLLGYSGPATGVDISNFLAAVDFPGDSLTIQFDGTNAAPNARQVGRVGVPEDSGGLVVPYAAVATGQSLDYVGYEFLGGTNCIAGSAAPCGAGPAGATVGTSNSHNVGTAVGLFFQAPLWGEVGFFQSGCPNGFSGCTTPFAGNNARFTQNPGKPPFTAGTYVPVVNMQGSNSQAGVFALQALLPTGGAYSATIPAGPPNRNDVNGGCDGVVSGSSVPLVTGFFPTDPFPNGGAAWLFTSPASPNNPNLACTVTFGDGFNSFKVIFTNTGAQNPVPTPAPPVPTASPTPGGFGGPTATASPQI